MINKGDKLYCIKAQLPKYITPKKSYTALDVDTAGNRVVLMNDNKYTDWYDLNDFQVLEARFNVGETVFCYIDVENHFDKGGKYKILETLDNKGRFLIEDKNKKPCRFGVTNFSRIPPVPTAASTIITQPSLSTIPRKVRGPHKCTCDFHTVIVPVGCQCNGL